MRVRDAETSIYHGLLELPWPRYLSAMWIVCGELQSLYWGWLNDGDKELVAETMDVVRQVVIAGKSPEATRDAKKLARAWGRLSQSSRADEASAGLENAWMTFEALAQEISGICGQYDGANWVTNAATERWRVYPPDFEGPIVEDPNEETDDAGPMAQTLALFERIVTKVAEAQGPDLDPASLRAQIFAQP